MKRLTLKDAERAFELYKAWIGEGMQPAGSAQAQARANICLTCPKNVEKPLQEFLTGAVALTVRKQIELKNKLNLRVMGEKSLHVCDVCQCVLRLKVHVPTYVIRQSTKQEIIEHLPDFCWQKKEITNDN
jgi:hypothetical protein